MRAPSSWWIAPFVVACRSEPTDVMDVAARDLGCPRAQLTKSSFGENQSVVYGCGKCVVYGHPLGLWGADTRVTNVEALKRACGPDASVE